MKFRSPELLFFKQNIKLSLFFFLFEPCTFKTLIPSNNKVYNSGVTRVGKGKPEIFTFFFLCLNMVRVRLKIMSGKTLR